MSTQSGAAGWLPTAMEGWLALALDTPGGGEAGEPVPGAAAEAADSVAGVWSVIDAIVFGEKPKLRFKRQQKRRGSLHRPASRFLSYEIGRASRRERVCRDGWISGVGVAIKKKKMTK